MTHAIFEMSTRSKMPLPTSKSGWVIYANPTCPFCITAKIFMTYLVEKRIIKGFKYVDLGQFSSESDKLQNYIGRDYPYVPIVFNNLIFIGGVTETFDHFVSV